MNILFINNGYFPDTIGGTEVYLKSLANELLDRGHEINILVPKYSLLPKYSLSRKDFEGVSVYILRIPQRILIKNIMKYGISLGLYYNPEIYTLIKDIIKKIQPDLVHFHNTSQWRNPEIFSIPRRFNIPSILTLHDYWFICSLSTLHSPIWGPCTGPNPAKCKECWSNAVFSNNFFKLLGKTLTSESEFRRRQEIFRNALNSLNQVIAPSKFIQATFERVYPEIKNRVIHIQNGYPHEVFKGFKKLLPADYDSRKIVFGFTGRISYEKGLHVLLHAFSKLPHDAAELKIYGVVGSNSEYVQKLFRIIRNNENICYCGKFDHVTTPYSMIDVLIFPSIWYENCPLVLAESRLAKTPVIASNIGAIPEFVEHNKTGLLFRRSDHHDLYQKMKTIVENPELIREFSKNITPPPSMEEHANDLERLYLEITSR